MDHRPKDHCACSVTWSNT